MATGLLCSDDDENVSSPDASSEDDVSDVEDIDETPDCPVTSGVQSEDGVALSGRSSPRLVASQPVFQLFLHIMLQILFRIIVATLLMYIVTSRHVLRESSECTGRSGQSYFSINHTAWHSVYTVSQKKGDTILLSISLQLQCTQGNLLHKKTVL